MLRVITACSLILSVILFASGAAPSHAQDADPGPSFTYQGRVLLNGSPVTGSIDVEIEPFDAPSGGTPFSNAVTVLDVPVAEGVFTVTVAFDDVLSAGDVYLELRVKDASNDGPFTTLSPRQQVTPAPIAAFSLATSGLPASGDEGAVLTKNSDEDRDTFWSRGLAIDSVEADVFVYPSQQQRTLLIPPTEFQPGNQLTAMWQANQFVGTFRAPGPGSTLGFGQAFAKLDLPDNAIVTSVEFWMTNNDDVLSNALTARLSRVNIETGAESFDTLTEFYIPGTRQLRTLTPENVSAYDADAEYLLLQLSTDWWGPGALQTNGARITYVVDGPM